VLVKTLKGYNSSVTISKGEKSVDMKKLLALMGMGIKQGDTVTVKVEGDDEETCAAEIEKALKENF
jgi:phosphocarrier protein